jgi:O-methyltransferase involved in polyketide biosynthesis
MRKHIGSDGSTILAVGMRWIDVDLPEVVDLRRKLLPEPQGGYQLIAGSVLDDTVLNAIPNDRPTVVIFEGLAMYLEASDAEHLIRRLCTRFESEGGELQFDGLGWMSLAVQRWSRLFVHLAFLKQSKAEWHYAVDDPWALARLHPGLKLVSDALLYENEGIKELSNFQQWEAWVLLHLPGFRYISRMMRYTVLRSN